MSLTFYSGKSMKEIKIQFANQGGFTLLEIMIAMVIFAIGLLGLAGLQAMSLQNDHASYSRSQAILLAYEMADRIRTNPAGSVNYIIDANTNVVAGYTGSNMCTANNCTITDMVKYDMGLWKASVAALLPSGKASISNPSTNNHVITIHWDEERTGVTGTTCPNPGAADLSCFQILVTL